MDKIENWTNLKIGQNWKLDKTENRSKSSKLEIWQKWKLEKIENWAILKIEQNWKLNFTYGIGLIGSLHWQTPWW